jgi:hypothetical protein
MVTFSLPRESWWPVDLRCLLSGRSGLQFASLHCTFEEVDNIFRLAVGIAVYDEVFSCMCADEFLCALDVFARHTSKIKWFSRYARFFTAEN